MIFRRFAGALPLGRSVWILSCGGILQLPTPLVFICCLLSGPIFLPKRRIIYRPIFQQINTYYTVEYCTECILSETQKENKIIYWNNKQEQLNNTVDTINQHLTPVININYIKTNVSYAKVQNRWRCRHRMVVIWYIYLLWKIVHQYTWTKKQ